MPDEAKLYVSAISDIDYHKERFGFWKSVYGNKMTNMMK
jgi:hypothetical protein